ncbi:MAG TPA: hypothetical protein VF053_13675 [Streptosporangiales bacterium]
MPEGDESASDPGGEPVPAANGSRTGGTGERGDGSRDGLPDDYYVRLRPLTLDLVATQLDRIGVKYQRSPERLQAVWSTFWLSVHIAPTDVLCTRSTFLRPYPAASGGVLTGWCNWWNSTQTFLKASTVSQVGQVDPGGADGERRPVPQIAVVLDFEVPLSVGVAPVQLQSLLRMVVGNVSAFERWARLDQALARPAKE